MDAFVAGIIIGIAGWLTIGEAILRALVSIQRHA